LTCAWGGEVGNKGIYSLKYDRPVN
jgi:hypothetical protein